MIEQDNCFIIQQIDNKSPKTTYIAECALPPDDKYREQNDHIWTVLQFVE